MHVAKPLDTFGTADEPRGSRTLQAGQQLGILPQLQDYKSPPPPPPPPPSPAAVPSLSLPPSARQPQPSPPPPLAPGELVRLSSPLPGAPEGFTGAAFHGAAALEGATFFSEATVADRDEGHDGTVYHWRLSDRTHGLSFNVGQSADGPLVNCALPTAFYRLRDGSAWAEHMELLDADDVAALGRKLRLPFRALADEMREGELVLLPPRRHRRLEEVELDCAVYTALEFEQLRYERALPEGALFCRHALDGATLRVVGSIRVPWEVEPNA